MSKKKNDVAKKKNDTPKKDKESNIEASSLMHKILGKKVKIKFKNKRQKDFSKLIREDELVFCAGPAGSGKSYLSIGIALEMLQDKNNSFESIRVTKPAVEVDEKYGFLPGDIMEKLEPYLASSIDIIDKIIGQSKREQLEEKGLIKVEPLGFIRGKTLDNTILVVEEAQNMSPRQMKTLLTRIGENSKYIVSGDLDQSDRYKKLTQTALYDVFNRHTNIPELGFFQFDNDDIVRNPLIGKILNNYEVEGGFKNIKLIKNDEEKN